MGVWRFREDRRKKGTGNASEKDIKKGGRRKVEMKDRRGSKRQREREKEMKRGSVVREW